MQTRICCAPFTTKRAELAVFCLKLPLKNRSDVQYLVNNRGYETTMLRLGNR